ncbi:MAG: class I SAM-dependent methyltransferase [Pseudomonadota bacterium]
MSGRHVAHSDLDRGKRCCCWPGEQLFGDSYARTLAIWNQRLEQGWPQIKPLGFDERFRRMWGYYLDYCRVGFETSAVDVGLYSFSRS